MVTVIENAPAWMNFVLMLCVVVAGIYTTYRATQKSSEAAQKTASVTQASLEEIRAEVKPNHGSSTRDAIDRIESSVKEIHKAMDRHEDDIAQVRDDLLDIRTGLRQGIERLAAADAEDRARADEVHQMLWTALDA